MGKHTLQTNDLSGNKKLYEYEGGLVEVLPTFTYEVSLHKYWKNGYCFLGSQLYKADRLLHLKGNCVITKYKGYRIEKEIVLIGVPEEFIKEQQLKIYELKPKIKKSKKK